MSFVPSPKSLRALACAALAVAAGFAALAPASADEGTPPAPPAPEKAADAAPKAASVWFADYDKAAEAAKAQGKDLLVDFTGSDWCGWCIRLEREVFSQAEFLDTATKDFVLVSLDFPNGEAAKAKVPNPDRNAKLAELHEVEGFPTVLFMTAEGDVYGRGGYEAGGPGPWVASMQKHRLEGRASLVTAKGIEKEFADAKGDARAPLAEKAVALVEKAGAGAAWVSRILPAARAALEVDPQNAKGLKARAVKAMLRNGTADDSVIAEAAKLDPKNEAGIRELAVAMQLTTVSDEDGVRAAAKAIEELDAMGPIKDAETRITLWANAAFWNLRVLNDAEKAKVWAKKLKTVADPKNEALKQLLADCLGEEAAPAPAPAPGGETVPGPGGVK